MGESEVLVHFQLHNKFEAILNNKRACLKTEKIRKKKGKGNIET